MKEAIKKQDLISWSQSRGRHWASRLHSFDSLFFSHIGQETVPLLSPRRRQNSSSLLFFLFLSQTLCSAPPSSEFYVQHPTTGSSEQWTGRGCFSPINIDNILLVETSISLSFLKKTILDSRNIYTFFYCLLQTKSCLVNTFSRGISYDFP